MKTLLILSLLFPVRPTSAESFKDKISYGGWRTVAYYLKAQMAERLEQINRTGTAVVPGQLEPIGYLLASLNLLAQGPCRRDEALCRQKMVALLTEVLSESFAEVPARGRGSARLRRQFLEQIKDQTEPELLRRRTVEGHRAFLRSPLVLSLASLEAAMFGALAGVATHAIINYVGLAVDHATATSVVGVAVAAGAAFWRFRYRTTPRRWVKNARDVVSRPLYTCAHALASAEINRAASSAVAR